MTKEIRKPWDFLDEYRGKEFSGEWPTVPEMFSDFLIDHALRTLRERMEANRLFPTDR